MAGYDNCCIKHPDGSTMFMCSKRKWHWYINKGLATIISDNPPIAKLLFIPGGMGESNVLHEYRDNKCVQCGTNADLTYHHVVPYMYRKQFPDTYKTHNSYDVLLMCETCHRTYEKCAMEYKAYLESNCDELDSVRDQDISDAKRSLNALRHYSINIPADKIDVLNANISNVLLKHNLTLEQIDKHKGTRGSGFKKAEAVIKYYGVEALIKMWRKHFLDNTKCKHLPTWFSVDEIRKKDR